MVSGAWAIVEVAVGLGVSLLLRAIAIGLRSSPARVTAAILLANACVIAMAAIMWSKFEIDIVDHVESVVPGTYVPGAPSHSRLKIARASIEIERSVMRVVLTTIFLFDCDGEMMCSTWNVAAFVAFFEYVFTSQVLIPRAFVAGEYAKARNIRRAEFYLLAFAACAFRPFGFARAFMILECACASHFAWWIIEGFDLGAERARTEAAKIPDANDRVR